MNFSERQPPRLSVYAGGMAGKETFTERFKRLTDGMTDMELSNAMGARSTGPARDLRSGDTKMIKLDQAYNLCRYFADRGRPIELWDFLGLPDPQAKLRENPTLPAASPRDGGALPSAIDELRQEIQATNHRFAEAFRVLLASLPGVDHAQVEKQLAQPHRPAAESRRRRAS